MLIARQKFRSSILGPYFRLCHITTCNMHETWSLIYSCAMRTFPMSCHVVLQMQWGHVHTTWRAHADKPATLCICSMPGITYGCAICASRTIFIKINHLTFSHPKHDFRKLEHAEKDSYCHAQWEQGRLNENFRICAEESVAPLYQR